MDTVSLTIDGTPVTVEKGTTVLQAASRVFAAKGDALDDWRILVDVASALGAPLAFEGADDVRRAVAGSLGAAYVDVAQAAFANPMTARDWLQGSNSSERWKWDFLSQDLPPVTSG